MGKLMNPNMFLQKKTVERSTTTEWPFLFWKSLFLSNEPHDFFKDYKSSFWGMAIVWWDMLMLVCGRVSLKRLPTCAYIYAHTYPDLLNLPHYSKRKETIKWLKRCSNAMHHQLHPSTPCMAPPTTIVVDAALHIFLSNNQQFHDIAPRRLGYEQTTA